VRLCGHVSYNRVSINENRLLPARRAVSPFATATGGAGPYPAVLRDTLADRIAALWSIGWALTDFGAGWSVLTGVVELLPV
jgi:hypothetical protein